MEENMQQVGSVLGNLKNMAADMGQEIDRQNKQLDKIGAKVTTLDVLLKMTKGDIFYIRLPMLT